MVQKLVNHGVGGLTLLVGWIKGGDNFVQCPGFRKKGGYFDSRLSLFLR